MSGPSERGHELLGVDQLVHPRRHAGELRVDTDHVGSKHGEPSSDFRADTADTLYENG